MRTAPIGGVSVSVLLCALVAFGPRAEAATTCRQRVAQLKALEVRESARTEAHKQREKSGPVTVPVDNYLSLKAAAEREADWKKRGVRLTAAFDGSIDEEIEPAYAREILELASQAKVQLCVVQNGPVEQKESLAAEARLVAPLLAAVAALPPEDRATKLSQHVMDGTWSCRGIQGSFEAVAHARPSDKLMIVTKLVAESLEECGCPASEAERIFALLSLMADVWEEKEVCLPFVVGSSPTARPTTLAGPVMKLVKALEDAGASGVSLPRALPPRPAPAVKKP